MLKVVIFDGGYGGEFLADRIEEELPILEIIRVIDWRNASDLLSNPKRARKIAEDALRPYIGQVDLIILASCFLTITSLKYFRKKYKKQRFVGLSLECPRPSAKHDIVILATKAITRTLGYYSFMYQIKNKTRTLILDTWPMKIDDGVLSKQEINETLKLFSVKEKIEPKEFILACSQFYDIEPNLRELYGKSIKIYDGFNDVIKKTSRALNIRGGLGKKAR